MTPFRLTSRRPEPGRARRGVESALLVAVALAGCGQEGSQPAPGATGPALFRDAAKETGLDFVHFNGMSGELYYVEMVGAGVALFDYDSDGDLDVYLVQGHMLGGKPLAQATLPPPGPPPFRDRLYRNDLTVAADGTRRLHFTDVTAAAGIDVRDYGMGVAAGDYDNDGHVDLYVTNFGPNRLLRNRGDGSFVDVTAQAGEAVADPRWSTGAVFVDVDQDGWLDLFSCNYVVLDLNHHKVCRTPAGAADYCGPRSFTPEPDRLLHNNRDGSFTDITAGAGVAAHYGACLGVVAADFDGDGRPDLYVANDGAANQLWINQGDGRFVDQALFAGAALNRDGMPEASMGVDAADFENDGDEDLFLTHLKGETNTLYRNDGHGLFTDDTESFGLGAVSRPYTAFGTAWIDYDNDGWLDLFIANGQVSIDETQLRAGEALPLRQPNQLFHNRGDGRFEAVTRTADAVFALSEVSRATAFGDIDNDGDTDLLVTNNGGPVRLLVNQSAHRNHWLGLRLFDPARHRDAYGARVELRRQGQPTLWRRVRATASYLAGNDTRVLVGLGGSTAVEAVRVHWPDGLVEEWRGLAVDAYHQLNRGEGRRP
jgi:hypothetical protein